MVKAQARYVRIAPRKARIVMDQSGKIGERSPFTFYSQAGLRFIEGAASAVANTEHNNNMMKDELAITRLMLMKVNERFRPRARAGQQGSIKGQPVIYITCKRGMKLGQKLVQVPSASSSWDARWYSERTTPNTS